MIVFHILGRTVCVLIEAAQFIMLVHAVMSWFPPSDGKGGPIRTFIGFVTEIFVSPVRALLERFEWARRSPIDISFFVTFLLLSILSTVFSTL